MKTNEALTTAAAVIPGGKLYGSATANLLYDDPSWSRALPGFYAGPLHDYLRKVLVWVLASMPKVQTVACLGQEAWFLTCVAIECPKMGSRFAEYRDAGRPLVGMCAGKSITAVGLFHPAARVTNQAKQSGWLALSRVVSETGTR